MTYNLRQRHHLKVRLDLSERAFFFRLKGEIILTKIIAFGVTQEEAEVVKKWSTDQNIHVDMTPEYLTPETVHLAKGYDGITNMQVSNIVEPVYTKLKELGIRVIGQRSAGYEMYDLKAASQNDIIITNVPSYSPESIAEFSVFAAMRLIRNSDIIDQRVEAQNFTWEPIIRSRPIKNLKIAVIGVGRIGSRVAKIYKHGFGAEVVAYDIVERDEFREHVDYQPDLLTAVKDADVITIHMPLTEDNYHQFNRELFKQMKTGATLINAARGKIVKTQDLVEAIDSGQIKNAALDVYEGEGPFIPQNWEGKVIQDDVFLQILNHPNIYYTPHIAYYTDIAVQNLVEGGLNSALEVIQTGTAQNRVN